MKYSQRKGCLLSLQSRSASEWALGVASITGTHWLSLSKKQQWRAAICGATRSSLGFWKISLKRSADHYEEQNWKVRNFLCCFPVMWANLCYITTLFFFKITVVHSGSGHKSIVQCFQTTGVNFTWSKALATAQDSGKEEEALLGLQNIKMLGYLHSEHKMTSAVLLI